MSTSRSLGRVLLVACGIALGLAAVEAGMRATSAANPTPSRDAPAKRLPLRGR